MKIVAIADTHGKHRKVDLPEGDVLVHAGDFTTFGSGQADFLRWLEEQPFDHRLLILGNHEGGSLSGVSKHRLEGELEQRNPITYIGLATATIDGIIFGSTGETDLDVLVTHQPPKGVLDYGFSKHWPDVDITSKKPDSPTERLGSPAIKNQCKRCEPDVHIFGHVHSASGREKRADTLFVNCALAGKDYEPVNPPRVIEL